jgi:ABC-2 type transport system permease protein
MSRTVYVMWVREVKKFMRSRSRIVAALGQPILFLLALGYGLGGVFQAAGQGNYFQFLVPGVLGMAIIFTSIFNGMQIIWDRQFGFLKETLVAPVSRGAIMLGRTFGGATVATVQGCIVFVLTLLFGFHPCNWALLVPAVLLMFLIASLFSALGITVAIVCQRHARLSTGHEFSGDADVLFVRCAFPAHQHSAPFKGAGEH